MGDVCMYVGLLLPWTNNGTCYTLPGCFCLLWGREYAAPSSFWLLYYSNSSQDGSLLRAVPRSRPCPFCWISPVWPDLSPCGREG